ncbi:MAG TPA: PAS domain S-box protein, partial [bacterium]|nr:PAS domain S-box protein [bacterium]
DDSASPIRDELGNISGSVLIFRDITERRLANRTQALLASIVATSDDAIVSKTLEGQILSWNDGAERLFGYSAAEAVGESIMIIIPPDRWDEERTILQKIRRGERVDHYETIRVGKDGRRLEISLTVSPIHDEDGQIIGASKIARDISDRKRAEEALLEADRRKDRFLAMLAHELRNPLAPVRNSIEVMKRAGPDAQLIERARDTIDRQMTQMERLIEDLLDVSRITHNRLVLRRERVSLSSVLALAVEAARPLAEFSGHDLQVMLPSQEIVLNADPARLAQVFGNLLNNSCRYTESKGKIVLSAKRVGSHALVSVKDNGIGIPPDMLSRIFETFVQVDQSLERAQEGMGLGLTLVQEIVRMHGGDVEAKSGGAGQGSEFVVRLPIFIEGAQETVRTSGEPAESGARPQRILVVDDNEDSAASLALLLHTANHETRSAYDGEEALRVAAEFRPDVILLDIGLPKLNGYEVCRRIREESWGKNIRIVAVTGWGQAGDRRESTDAGFDGHLVKPASPESLLAFVAPHDGNQRPSP